LIRKRVYNYTDTCNNRYYYQNHKVVGNGLADAQKADLNWKLNK